MPMAFQAAGYETALVGKWHLGTLPRFSPLKSGYDHFWGIRGGGVDYFSHGTLGGPDLWDGDTPVEQTGYLTDLLGQKSVEMLDHFAGSDRPFFMSLHFTAPHWPWIAPDDQAESARISGSDDPLALVHYDSGTLATYAEMVKRLDYQIGRLVDRLDELGLGRNTIVIFSSDNGGERFSDTWPFTGRKTELLEGGIRVPTIMRWPDGALPIGENDTPMMSMDWFPTLLGMAGVAAPKDHAFDGVDLTVAMRGGDAAERDLFWRYKIFDQAAVRRGNWKYLKIKGNEFLFDIVADPLERANLMRREPAVFETLKASYGAWNAGMLPYDDASFSATHNGATTADRFGINRSKSAVGRAY